MAEITAAMVKELREATGLGMMECKKALTEADGDLKKAEELMRIKSGAKASKVAGRIAADGAVGVHIAADGKSGAMVEVNCETDFVGKDANFRAFVDAVAMAAAQNDVADVDGLAKSACPGAESISAAREGLVMKLGENISIRRSIRYQTQGRLATYLHGSKIGVMIDYTGGDESLGKDLAMHIAASKPICVSKEQVSSELLARERLIYTAQAAESGKPADIVAKMVEGRVSKYLAEVTLLGQPFVKDPDQTVEKLLSAKSSKVNGFTMFVVGEGMEKKSCDFAAEVMAQVNQAK